MRRAGASVRGLRDPMATPAGRKPGGSPPPGPVTASMGRGRLWHPGLLDPFARAQWAHGRRSERQRASLAPHSQVQHRGPKSCAHLDTRPPTSRGRARRPAPAPLQGGVTPSASAERRNLAGCAADGPTGGWAVALLRPPTTGSAFPAVAVARWRGLAGVLWNFCLLLLTPAPLCAWLVVPMGTGWRALAKEGGPRAVGETTHIRPRPHTRLGSHPQCLHRLSLSLALRSISACGQPRWPRCSASGRAWVSPPKRGYPTRKLHAPLQTSHRHAPPCPTATAKCSTTK
jgi:hypothetical protein